MLPSFSHRENRRNAGYNKAFPGQQQARRKGRFGTRRFRHHLVARHQIQKVKSCIRSVQAEICRPQHNCCTLGASSHEQENVGMIKPNAPSQRSTRQSGENYAPLGGGHELIHSGLQEVLTVPSWPSLAGDGRIQCKHRRGGCSYFPQVLTKSVSRHNFCCLLPT